MQCALHEIYMGKKGKKPFTTALSQQWPISTLFSSRKANQAPRSIKAASPDFELTLCIAAILMQVDLSGLWWLIAFKHV